MSKTHRISRIALVVVSGLFAIGSFVPTGAVAASLGDATGTTSIVLTHGPGWCC